MQCNSLNYTGVPTARHRAVAGVTAPRRGSRSGTVSYRKSQQGSIFVCLLFCYGWLRSRLPSLRQLCLQHFGILQLQGSRADIVVLIQMKATSNHSSLPTEQLQWLTCMNIRIKYIPKSPQENFFRTMLYKVRRLPSAHDAYENPFIFANDCSPRAIPVPRAWSSLIYTHPFHGLRRHAGSSSSLTGDFSNPLRADGSESMRCYDQAFLEF
jgi:hypothetical protein